MLSTYARPVTSSRITIVRLECVCGCVSAARTNVMRMWCEAQSVNITNSHYADIVQMALPACDIYVRLESAL